MALAAKIAIALVALLHVWFAVIEMFLWDKPYGRRAFGLTPEFATASKALAANQGLYNLFLAAGLAWGLAPGPDAGAVRLFFLGCVIVAGIYGGMTVKPRIMYLQAGPALVALLALLAF